LCGRALLVRVRVCDCVCILTSMCLCECIDVCVCVYTVMFLCASLLFYFILFYFLSNFFFYHVSRLDFREEFICQDGLVFIVYRGGWGHLECSALEGGVPPGQGDVCCVAFGAVCYDVRSFSGTECVWYGFVLLVGWGHL
jgi:hypothetical protein